MFHSAAERGGTAPPHGNNYSDAPESPSRRRLLVGLGAALGVGALGVIASCGREPAQPPRPSTANPTRGNGGAGGGGEVATPGTGDTGAEPAPNIDPTNINVGAVFKERVENPKFLGAVGALFAHKGGQVTPGETVVTGDKYSKTMVAIGAKNNPNNPGDRHSTYSISIRPSNEGLYQSFLTDEARYGTVEANSPNNKILYSKVAGAEGPAYTMLLFTSGDEYMPPALITSSATNTFFGKHGDPNESKVNADIFGLNHQPVDTFLNLQLAR